ncbi:MAG: hypothetical protein AAF975_02780 [Spirochaetota bacterium]
MNNTIQTLIKSSMLLIFIMMIIVGGLLLFDWLGLMSLRQEFAPILRLVGLNTPSSMGASADSSVLNDARLRQQLDSLELKRKNLEELEKQLNQRSNELDERELAITQSEEQLQQQLDSLEEREGLYRERDAKVKQIAQNFNSMPPADAVAQMNMMNALLVVDVLRAADRIAVEEKGTSLVSYWISQMPPERGAEVNKLLVEKP